MRIFKNHPLLKLMNSYVVDASQPSNINYLWNFGSLLLVCLIIQIVTGVTLAMHYNPSVAEAFNSVEHIMRDVNNGWLVRYLHSNTASAFFFLVYLHMGRGIYYASYRAPRSLTWVLGVIIFLVMIITGFLGFLNMAQDKIKNRIITRNTITNNPFGNISRRNYSTSIDKRNSTISDIATERFSVNNSYARIDEFLELKKFKKIVYIFDDIDQDSIQKSIAKKAKNLSGIYLILNKETFSFYIGSASTNRFNARFTSHLIYLTGSKPIKNSLRQNKISNFCFIILELFEEIVTMANNKKLLDLEDFYLKQLLPDYNILTEAGSSFGYKHTEVTRLSMSSGYSDERRERIGNLNRNKKLRPETIEAIRHAALNRGKIIYTEEGILNKKTNSKPLIVKEFSGIVYGEYSSIVEGAKALNCSTKTIQRSLNSPSKQLKRRWIVSSKNNA